MASKARNRHVRNMTQGVRVVAGYLRLSVDREGLKIGYDVQKAAINRHCTLQGWNVVWYQDSDITAGDEEVVRPEYERMLTDLQAGLISGIVVWKLDRLVRLTYEYERCINLVRKAGGFIVDVEQGYNTETPAGEIVMRILVMVAQMEIANMRERQAAHQREKARRGEFNGGGVRRFGFVGAEFEIGKDGKPLDGKEGRKRVITNRGQIGVAHVAAEAELLREAKDRILNGANYSDVLRDWASRTPPVMGTQGRPMHTESLQDILTAPRIAGLRALEEEDPKTGETVTRYFKAVWEPIISRAEWERLCALKGTRSEFQPKADYLLNGGLSVCGFSGDPDHGCGHRLIGAQKFGRVWDGKKYRSTPDVPRVVRYQCESTAGAKNRGHCGKTSILSGPTEKIVVEALAARLEQTPGLLDIVNERDNTAVDSDLKAALREMDECDRELGDLARRSSLRPDDPDWLDDVEWVARRQGFRARKASASATMERARKQLTTPVPQGEDRNDIKAWFDRLDLGQKRAFLGRFVVRVEIGPARRGATSFDPHRIRPFFADAKHLRGVGDE